MDIASVFKWFAQESINVAERANEPEQREKLLKLALMWETAAQQCRRPNGGDLRIAGCARGRRLALVALVGYRVLGARMCAAQAASARYPPGFLRNGGLVQAPAVFLRTSRALKEKAPRLSRAKSASRTETGSPEGAVGSPVGAHFIRRTPAVCTLADQRAHFTLSRPRSHATPRTPPPARPAQRRTARCRKMGGYHHFRPL
jgi:hypothetical protein